MYALTIIIAALGFASAAPSIDARQVAQVGSVDRYTTSGCNGGVICNIAGSGDLFPGCNVVKDQCKQSLRFNGVKAGCKVAIWTDTACKDAHQFANVTTVGDCYELGPPILGISVDC